MPTCFRFLFSHLLVLFFLLLTASLSSPQPLCHQDESLALMQFKDSFIIDNQTFWSCYPKTASWSVEAEHGRSDCCSSWDGVECDPHTGHVIGLDLSDGCLYGSINSNSSLFHLSHLRSLNLAFNYFNYSKIPSTIGNLTGLTNLNLSDSSVSGEIPSEVSYLSKLSSLDLSYNYHLFYIESLTRLGGCGLYGEFPIRIFQLPQLQDLRIGNNEDLTGQLPEFHSSNVLQALSLYYTNFSGSIPNSFWNLTQLTVLYLSGNSFVDLSCLTKASSNHTFPHLQYLVLFSLNLTKFPNFLQNQNKLVLLDLSGNNIQGIIPKCMFNASKEDLQDLYLSNNLLTGFEDSRDVLPWPNLRWLDLENNRLQGSLPISQIPPSIQYLYLSNNLLTGFEDSRDVLPWPNLLALDLQNNSLQGSLPISQIPPSIQDLDLSNNLLTGFEDSRDVLPWPNLLTLDLQNNRLQGSLPIPPPSVLTYHVSKNAFTGEISPLFCNLSSLSVLDLSYNNLSGKLHPCLCNLSQSLIALELRSNNIVGTIPDAWAKGCRLSVIDLNHNQLQGRLPRSLANCKELVYLDVGYNKIHDTFPLWLGTLPELKIFILRSNGFYGAIRNIQINCTLSNLHIIDLSNNNFSGDLPAECFQQWNTMKLFGAKEFHYLDYNSAIRYSITLTTKGIELVYERIQDELIVIDLSCNRFEGEIPEVVGNLKGLHILNFSNNALSGRIPSSLANLTSLESLDLSQNKLFGEIPPQLAQLTFLEIFKVFNNCLTGPIPHGSQFERFPNSSFDGNPGLCGMPLSKACGDSLPKPPTLTFEGNQGLVSPFEFGWKVVAIGYECGFVIGIVIGQWVIARKQDWFVNTFRIKK